MNEFKKEDRYLVIKRTDLQAALLIATPALTNKIESALGELSSLVGLVRDGRGAGEFVSVVVESDWPEYEPTWTAIEKRMRTEQ